MPKERLDAAYKELEPRCRRADYENARNRGNTLKGLSLCDALNSAYLHLILQCKTDPGSIPEEHSAVVALLEKWTRTKLGSAYRRALRELRMLERNGPEVEPNSPFPAADKILMAKQKIDLICAELGDDEDAKHLVKLVAAEVVDYKDNIKFSEVLDVPLPEVTNIKKRITNAAYRVFQRNIE